MSIYFVIFGSAETIISNKGNFLYDRLRNNLPKDCKNQFTTR